MIKIWKTPEFPYFADYGTGDHDFELTEIGLEVLKQHARNCSKIVEIVKKQSSDLMQGYLYLAEKSATEKEQPWRNRRGELLSQPSLSDGDPTPKPPNPKPLPILGLPPERRGGFC
jgi:hypothetical protein